MAKAPTAFVTMTITGVDESIETIETIPKKVQKALKKELKLIGKDMLSDLRAITPVVTGRLRRSSFFDIDDSDESYLEAFLGYKAPYAPEVEMRRGMLATTLEIWNEQLHNRLSAAMQEALEKLGGKTTKAETPIGDEMEDTTGSDTGDEI